MAEETKVQEVQDVETSEEPTGLKDIDNLVAFVSMLFLVFLMGVAVIFLYVGGKL